MAATIAMPFGAALVQVLEIYSVVLALHIVIPAPRVAGYVCEFGTGRPLMYRLNALRVLLATVALYAGLAVLGIRDPTALSDSFGNCWLAGVLIGTLLSVVVVVRAASRRVADAGYLRCLTADMVDASSSSDGDDGGKKRRIVTDPPRLRAPDPPHLAFWNGLEFNPRFFGEVDVKMMLYLWGAALLALNVASMAAAHVRDNGGQLSIAMACYCLMMGFFLCEYCYFEHVHLYTYDLFAEKLGFKLAFGCLGFYPFAYAIGATSLASYAPSIIASSTTKPSTSLPDMSISAAGLTVALFFAGWVMTRGANMQKFYFKVSPRAPSCLFGMIPQRTVPGSRILCSGFWGVSRHINYFGEIVQSIAISIPPFLVRSTPQLYLVPWLYVLYYLALFIPREIDDNEVCRRKYGQKWEEYCRLVPWRIVPYVY